MEDKLDLPEYMEKIKDFQRRLIEHKKKSDVNLYLELEQEFKTFIIRANQCQGY